MKNEESIFINYIMRVFFFIATLFIIAMNIYYSKSPILEKHGFRQTQTAITSYYMVKDGYKLDYETPTIGKNWSIPFEFPIYQGLVAGIVRISNFPLTQTGRIVSLFFLLLTCFPIFYGLRSLSIESGAIYYSLSLFLSSPIYIFYGGAFLIESAALFFGCCAMYYFIKILKGGSKNRDFLALFIFLTCAMLQKSTTILPAFLIFTAFFLYSTGEDCIQKNSKYLLKLSFCIIGPLIFLIAWTVYSDDVKALNPIGELLTSSRLMAWNFGTLDQRLSKALWLDVIFNRNIKIISLYFCGIFSITLALIFLKDRSIKNTIVVLLTLFIAPFLIFTNLHVIHDYYQISNSLFFSLAFGISSFYLFKNIIGEKPLLFIAALGFLIIGNIYYFKVEYFDQKKFQMTISNNRVLELSDYIIKNTPSNLPVVWFGSDWSSENAFYSERRSLTVPPWGNLEMEAITNTKKFLGKDRPSAFVLCPTPNIESLKKALADYYPAAIKVRVSNCEIYTFNTIN